MTFPAVVPFDRRRHDTAAFTCGKQPLDRWLRAYASQSQRRDAARTFVTARADGRVLGYYTLVAGQVEHESATTAVRKGMSRHFPIPVAIIARLAVHQAHHGEGLGRSLLLDALRRILRASEELAVRAVIVDAIDDDATAFYRHFGFEPSGLDPRLLMIELGAIRRALSSR
ncbi:MAG: GNAT family N-acetyltransferase [Thermoleophilaceae bacterium]